MPELARFQGIVVGRFFNEGEPPHFHADYGSEEAPVDVVLASNRISVGSAATGPVSWSSPLRPRRRASPSKHRGGRQAKRPGRVVTGFNVRKPCGTIVDLGHGYKVQGFLREALSSLTLDPSPGSRMNQERAHAT